MQSTDDRKYQFLAPNFYDFLNPPSRKLLESWFCEKNISGPSFPSTSQTQKKKRRLLRMNKLPASSASHPMVPKQKQQGPVTKPQQSNVFDRLSRMSTISSYHKRVDSDSQPISTNKSTAFSYQQRKPGIQPAADKGKHRELEGLGQAESVKERIARLESNVQQANSSRPALFSTAIDFNPSDSRSANTSWNHSLVRFSAGTDLNRADIKEHSIQTSSRVRQSPSLETALTRGTTAEKRYPSSHLQTVQSSRQEFPIVKATSPESFKHATTVAVSPEATGYSDVQPASQSNVRQSYEAYESVGRALSDNEEGNEEETTMQLQRRWMAYEESLKEKKEQNKRETLYKQLSEPDKDGTSHVRYQPVGKRKREESIVSSNDDNMADVVERESRESFKGITATKQRRLSITKGLAERRRSVIMTNESVSEGAVEEPRLSNISPTKTKRIEDSIRKETAHSTARHMPPRTLLDQRTEKSYSPEHFDDQADESQNIEGNNTIKEILERLRKKEERIHEERARLIKQVKKDEKNSSPSQSIKKNINISSSSEHSQWTIRNAPVNRDSLLQVNDDKQEELVQTSILTNTFDSSNDRWRSPSPFARHETEQLAVIRRPSIIPSVEAGKDIVPFKKIASTERLSTREPLISRQSATTTIEAQSDREDTSKQLKRKIFDMPEEFKTRRQSLLSDTHSTRTIPASTKTTETWTKEGEALPSYRTLTKYQQPDTSTLNHEWTSRRLLPQSRSPLHKSPAEARPSLRTSQAHYNPITNSHSPSRKVTVQNEPQKKEESDRANSSEYSRLGSLEHEKDQQHSAMINQPHNQHAGLALDIRPFKQPNIEEAAYQRRFSTYIEDADDNDHTQVEGREKFKLKDDTVRKIRIDNTNFLKNSESTVSSLQSSYHTAATELEETLRRREESRKAREEEQQRQEQQRMNQKKDNSSKNLNLHMTHATTSVLQKRTRAEPELSFTTGIDECILKARKVLEDLRMKREEWKRRDSIKLLDYEDYRKQKTGQSINHKHASENEKWKISTAASSRNRANKPSSSTNTAAVSYLPLKPTIPKSPSFRGK